MDCQRDSRGLYSSCPSPLETGKVTSDAVEVESRCALTDHHDNQEIVISGQPPSIISINFNHSSSVTLVIDTRIKKATEFLLVYAYWLSRLD